MKLDRDDLIGHIIHYISLSVPLIVIAASLGIMVFVSPYEYIRIRLGGRGIIHAISALSLSSAFLFIYLKLQYLYPLVRVIITSCFTVLSIHLYDFVWSFCKYVQLGYDFRLSPLISISIVVVLLIQFELKHRFLWNDLGQNVKMVLFSILFVLSFIALMDMGFYEAMVLYDNGLGSDPNVGCLPWVFSKVVVFWIFTPLLHKFPHKAPIRLDPRVLLW